MSEAAIVPVILSGGSGTRLWPASRLETPKQLLALVGEHSLLRATLGRLEGVASRQPPVVVCSQIQAGAVRQEMEAAGHHQGVVIIEPEGRNTAPAVAVAAYAVDPDAVLLVMPADHVLGDVEAFATAVAAGARAAASGSLVTFGVVPTHAATGYGYIRTDQDAAGVSPVAEFVEKPDLADAERFIAGGRHLWNSGMFMFTAGHYLSELARFEPEVAAAAAAAMDRADTDETGAVILDREAFARSPNISIDYAVMERTDAALVVPLDAGWSDVGSWASLMDVARQDSNGNVIVGDVIAEDVDGSYLRADGVLLAVVGLSDVVAVTTPDAVLVAAKDRAEDVKTLVDRLRSQGRSEADQSPVTVQEWGSAEVMGRIGTAAVTKHVITPGATARLDGGVAVVVQGKAVHGGTSRAAGTAFTIDPADGLHNGTDADTVVVVTSWPDQPAAHGDRILRTETHR
ncbi:MAG: mannose-1-phosphate guanylyltransferase/mannose-6-phosphate isomerase [Acidimicrobiia bacterium]|nr:mannose-1-phosphate guanylyltransferase/mannose-6-phosphate isomerase [Acidimicrobiia bacterium]